MLYNENVDELQSRDRHASYNSHINAIAIKQSNAADGEIDVISDSITSLLDDAVFEILHESYSSLGM
jgi:hypothetical protein